MARRRERRPHRVRERARSHDDRGRGGRGDAAARDGRLSRADAVSRASPAVAQARDRTARRRGGGRGGGFAPGERSRRAPRGRRGRAREERAPVRGRRRGHRILGGRRRARRGRHVVEARGAARAAPDAVGAARDAEVPQQHARPRRDAVPPARVVVAGGRAQSRPHRDGVGLAQRHEHRRDDGLSRHVARGRDASEGSRRVRRGRAPRRDESQHSEAEHFTVAARGGGHHARVVAFGRVRRREHLRSRPGDGRRRARAARDRRARRHARALARDERRGGPRGGRRRVAGARVSPMGRARRAVRALPLDARSERRVLVPPVRGHRAAAVPSPVDRLDASTTTHHQRRFEARCYRYRRPPLGHTHRGLCVSRASVRARASRLVAPARPSRRYVVARRARGGAVRARARRQPRRLRRRRREAPRQRDAASERAPAVDWRARDRGERGSSLSGPHDWRLAGPAVAVRQDPKHADDLGRARRGQDSQDHDREAQGDVRRRAGGERAARHGQQPARDEWQRSAGHGRRPAAGFER